MLFTNVIFVFNFKVLLYCMLVLYGSSLNSHIETKKKHKFTNFKIKSYKNYMKKIKLILYRCMYYMLGLNHMLPTFDIEGCKETNTYDSNCRENETKQCTCFSTESNKKRKYVYIWLCSCTKLHISKREYSSWLLVGNIRLGWKLEIWARIKRNEYAI